MKRLNMNAVLIAGAVIVAIIVGVLVLTGKASMPTAPLVVKEGLEMEMKAPEAPKIEETPVPEAADKVLSTDELLPKLSEEADDFVKQNPVAKMLKEQNFLVSGYHVGINTVLQSHKIPYHDLRSSPAISKSVVSPWNNSYIEAPAGSSTRRLFEIGSA